MTTAAAYAAKAPEKWAGQINKKLSYRRATARRALSVEILSDAVKLYKNHI